MSALGVRASSFAVSASLFGLAVFAALTMSFAVRVPDLGLDGGIIDGYFFSPPPSLQPDEERQVVRRLPVAPLEDGLEILPPLPPSDFPPTEVADSGGGVSFAPPMIRSPHWLRTPRGLETYYPERALVRGVEGRAELDCLVTTGGELNCVVMSETPAGWRFGEAALRISRDYRMVPAMQGGHAIEGRYRMAVPFELR